MAALRRPVHAFLLRVVAFLVVVTIVTSMWLITAAIQNDKESEYVYMVELRGRNSAYFTQFTGYTPSNSSSNHSLSVSGINNVSEANTVTEATVVSEANTISEANTVSEATITTARSTGSTHYKMVVGILSARRVPSTVIRMIEALLNDITLADYKLLVRMSSSGVEEHDEIQRLADLGITTYIHNETYRELAKDKVRITFKDPLARVIWRTSHVLDYAYLLESAMQFDSEFVLILEDDLKPARFALDKSYQFAKLINDSANYSDWGSITFYSSECKKTLVSVAKMATTGACAFMIRRSIIPHFVEYLRSDPYAAPVDTLLFRFMESEEVVIYERSPSIFQHISKTSTYNGKDQKKRMTEHARSVTFLYDETNHSLSSLPVREDGYIGCYKDQVEERDLSGIYGYPTDRARFRNPSPALCSVYCRQYLYYGLQAGGECYCGNEFGQHGAAPESECNNKCSKDPSKMCGGVLRNSVYKNLKPVCNKRQYKI